MTQYSVPLKQLAEEFELTIAYRSTDYEEIKVMVDEVSRPGLPLTGFFEHFEALRIEVLGYVEMTYLDNQTHEKRLEIFDRLFAYKIPALVISRGQQPHPECMEMAKKHNTTILISQGSTSYIISNLITSLKSALAPRITRHGVLVEIYGEGVLITGDSGIGKSETAVELLKRGHRLIMATNPLYPQIASAERTQWAGLDPNDFELITSYENCTYCKPNIRYYTEICENIGEDPKNCIMIGNHTGEDLIAREIGMDVFILTDCLIDEDHVDLTDVPHGSFDELFRWLGLTD